MVPRFLSLALKGAAAAGLLACLSVPVLSAPTDLAIRPGFSDANAQNPLPVQVRSHRSYHRTSHGRYGGRHSVHRTSSYSRGRYAGRHSVHRTHYRHGRYGGGPYYARRAHYGRGRYYGGPYYAGGAYYGSGNYYGEPYYAGGAYYGPRTYYAVAIMGIGPITATAATMVVAPPTADATMRIV